MTTSPPEWPTLVGSHRVRSRARGVGGGEDSVDIGILQVSRPAGGDPGMAPGQWALFFDRDDGGNFLESWLLRVASRLGLLPVRFTPAFVQALESDGPICLVADTNALYHGTLSQAVALRAGRATHVAIADQAVMELQRQRERAYAPKALGSGNAAAPTPVERWSRAAQRQSFLSAGARELKRLRARGHIVHVARPPEAMVRYFGGSRAEAEASPDGDEQGDLVGSNILRDRLVLESAFQQRVELPGVPVWLVTDDALLAEQADLEGLAVGFGWLAPRIEPRVLSSPFILPRTLRFAHVSHVELLDEMLWSSGVISLQQEGTGVERTWRVPEARRDRALASMGAGARLVASVNAKADVWSMSAAGGPPGKAPSPQTLLGRLLDRTEPVAPDADAYLRALGWIDDAGGRTERGEQLAAAWLAVDDADVFAWAKWVLDAGKDLDRLSLSQRLLGLLDEHPGATDKQLKDITGEPARTIESQLVLANAFGSAVRLSGKTWRARPRAENQAEADILEAIRSLQGNDASGSQSVIVAQVFTSFLPKTSEEVKTPMSLPSFRRAIAILQRAHRIAPSGSIPGARDRETTIHTIAPERGKKGSVVHLRVNLRDGSFLLPGVPCAAVMLI